MLLGIVDVGTLSLRFDVYRIAPGMRPELVERYRAMPRLGEGLYSGGGLTGAAAGRLREELVKVSELAARLGVERVLGVGTSALREPGADKLCEELRLATGITLRVLDGETEARLTALGILANEEQLPETVVFVDIGGGSTEVSLARAGEVRRPVSVPLGALRLKERFFNSRESNERYAPSAVAEARSEIARVLHDAPLPRREADLVVGSSGTLRALERLALGGPAHPERFSADDVKRFNERIERMTREEMLAIPGIEQNRIDVVLPGSLIVEGIMHELGIDRALVSKYSLRHGVLEEHLSQNKS